MITPPDELIAKPGDTVCDNVNRHIPVGYTKVPAVRCILVANHDWFYYYAKEPRRMWWKD